jgi:hypothetical protein
VLPKALDWYICEAVQCEVEDIVVDPLGNENFSPDFDRDQHMEPVGKHHQLYSMWGQITQEIDKLMKKRDALVLLLTCCQFLCFGFQQYCQLAVQMTKHLW